MGETVDIRYGSEVTQQEIEKRAVQHRQRAFVHDVLGRSQLAQFAIGEAPAPHIGTLVQELLDEPPIEYDEDQLTVVRRHLTAYNGDEAGDDPETVTQAVAETFSSIFKKHQASKIGQCLVRGTMPKKQIRNVIHNALKEESAPDNKLRLVETAAPIATPAEAPESSLEGTIHSGDAMCTDADPDTFFPEKGGSTKEAKRLCGLCPVSKECLDYALETDQRFGVWGGLSENERKRLQRKTNTYAKTA